MAAIISRRGLLQIGCGTGALGISAIASPPKEEVEYWNKMMSAMSPQTRIGIGKVSEALHMEGVLPRIAAPTLVITTDRSVLQPVETVLEYQKKIPNSRLLVLPSDAYHVAVAKADECVTNVLSFIKETRQRA
jgi:pimeloyl-ACP methyl ester carboxylesterase